MGQIADFFSTNAGIKLLLSVLLGGTLGYFIYPTINGRYIVTFDDMNAEMGHVVGTDDPEYGFQLIGTNVYQDFYNNYRACIDAESGTADVEYQFYIKIPDAHLSATENGEAIFKFFKGDNLLSNSDMRIRVNEGLEVSGDRVNITEDDYDPIPNYNGFSVATINVKATIPVNGSSDIYNLVAELYNDHAVEELDSLITNPDQPLPVRCQEYTNPDKLNIYKCIKAGNTHRKDHIFIKSLSFCNMAQ